MADNTDEEHLDIPTKIQSENRSDEIILTSNPDTINPIQAPDTMEVHKHPNHVTHRKKWGEYLLEFFMLFLAVFLGFVAENIREHSVEKSREKQYARLLLSDLRTDSASFLVRTAALQNRQQKNKLFLTLMTDSKTHSDKEVINAFLPLWHISPLGLTPVTFKQMENSGSLRYIENEKLLKLLQNYYENLFVTANLFYPQQQQFSSTIIYPFFLNHIRMQDIDDQGDSVIVANPVFMNRTKETDQQLVNIFANYASDQFNYQTRYVDPLIKTNKELINFIKEEYHLK